MIFSIVTIVLECKIPLLARALGQALSHVARETTVKKHGRLSIKFEANKRSKLNFLLSLMVPWVKKDALLQMALIIILPPYHSIKTQ